MHTICRDNTLKLYLYLKKKNQDWNITFFKCITRLLNLFLTGPLSNRQNSEVLSDSFRNDIS